MYSNSIYNKMPEISKNCRVCKIDLTVEKNTNNMLGVNHVIQKLEVKKMLHIVQTIRRKQQNMVRSTNLNIKIK